MTATSISSVRGRGAAMVLAALIVLPAFRAVARDVAPPEEMPPTSDQVPPGPEPLAPPSAPPPSAPLPSVPPDPRDGLDMAISAGAGLLEFFHLDVSVLISRQWAVGIGVGGFPIDEALTRAMGVDDLNVAAQLAGIELRGDVETRLGSGRIFGRWFPWKRLFLTELTLEAWRLRVTARGRATDVETEVDHVDVKVTTTVWVPMIGLHGGWRFLWKSGAFLEIVGGLNVLLSPGAEVEFGGTTVDELREYPEAAAALERAQEFLGNRLEDGANRITKEIKAFPTAALRFGWAFDFW